MRQATFGLFSKLYRAHFLCLLLIKYFARAVLRPAALWDNFPPYPDLVTPLIEITQSYAYFSGTVHTTEFANSSLRNAVQFVRRERAFAYR